MLTAEFTATFHAPIERAWELLTDYPGYARLPGVESARVLEPGRDHPAGVGALREIKLNGITFVERIEAFEPPHRLTYKIVTSKPITLDHELGVVQLSVRDGATCLHWKTTFAVAVPLIGGPLTHIARALMQRAFGQILSFVKTELESAV